MKTIGDRLIEVYKNYIAPTKADVKKGKKEEKIIEGDNRYPEQKDKLFSKKLTVEECIKAGEQCPLFMKGARKKAKDSIRAWHKIEHKDKTKKPFAIDLLYIDNFVRRNNLKRIWERLRVASFLTGDGYLLITYENDTKTKIDDEPTPNQSPYKVSLIPSQYIKEIGYHPERPEFKKKFVKHFHYQNQDIEYWIHPDRIIQMTCDEIWGPFGNSKINLLRNIIKSSVNVDIATGEILAWFAHGLLDIKDEDMQKEDLKIWKQTVNEHPSAYIHKDGDIKALEPKAIDPKPFYDYLILSIAAAYYMPTHILTGIQVGRVTGAEIGTGDYLKDCKDDQELVYTPLLNRLYELILKGKGRSWKNYEIVWNPIYIDELSEAEILYKRVQAADLAFNGARGAGGFINMEEARRIFSEGQIEIDPKKEIEVKEPQQQEPQEKPENTEKKKKEEIDLQKYNLDAATKIMIKKKKEQAEKERRLGEEILREQNDTN